MTRRTDDPAETLADELIPKGGYLAALSPLGLHSGKSWDRDELITVIHRHPAKPLLSAIEALAVLDALEFVENNCGLTSDAHIRAKAKLEVLSRIGDKPPRRKRKRK